MRVLKNLVLSFCVFLLTYFVMHFAFAGLVTDSRAIEFNAYNTNISPALSNLVNQMIEKNKYKDALAKLDEEIQKDPNNIALLNKKTELLADTEQWNKAITTIDQVITLQPNDTKAINLRKKLAQFRDKQPHNELGFDQDTAYVSDLNAYWQYSSLHYYRLTNKGNFGGRVNYAHRYGTTGKQFQVELFPQFSNNIYANLILGYANTTQILFPNLQYRIDGYYNTANGIEWSLGQGGQKYMRFSNQKIFLYTASLGKYQGNYYMWLRPFFYTPKSTEYYEIGIRRYFSDANNYIGVVLGGGRLPDIGDLPPIDQMIIINQRSIGLIGQISMTKTIFLKLRGGYVKQLYPGGLKREISDGNIGIVWQF